MNCAHFLDRLKKLERRIKCLSCGTTPTPEVEYAPAIESDELEFPIMSTKGATFGLVILCDAVPYFYHLVDSSLISQLNNMSEFIAALESVLGDIAIVTEATPTTVNIEVRQDIIDLIACGGPLSVVFSG